MSARVFEAYLQDRFGKAWSALPFLVSTLALLDNLILPIANLKQNGQITSAISQFRPSSVGPMPDRNDWVKLKISATSSLRQAQEEINNRLGVCFQIKGAKILIL